MVEKGRNSKLAQRVVRSRSKEREGGREGKRELEVLAAEGRI